MHAADSMTETYPEGLVSARTPGVLQLHHRVAALPRVAAYLRSERRMDFNEQGIFRRYPELDCQPTP